MKKTFFSFAALATLALGLTLTSCSDDDNTTENTIPEGLSDVDFEEENTVVTSSNKANWARYSSVVANLLNNDAADLLEAWQDDFKGQGAYATTFKNPGQGQTYTSYVSCAEQIIDGCIDIASEVGTSKIGEPRDYWESGLYSQAVYAVESWYSFHSIDDYSNNILSIRNAINGQRDGNEAEYSFATYLKENNSSLYNTLQAAISTAYNAIQSMTAPFRSHIGSSTVLVAMDACSDLEDVLNKQLKPYVQTIDEDDLQPIIEQYVDVVVLPTYQQLATRNATLLTAVQSLSTALTSGTDSEINSAFEVAAEAWMDAREPWETSEAFLFGPVDELGLDPNMDSWPLDADALKNILNTGDFSKLNWGDEDDDDTVEAAQNLRGYHTLEFLLFQQGQARTITD